MVNKPGMGGRGNQTPLELVRLRGNPGHRVMPDEKGTQALEEARVLGIADKAPPTLDEPGKALWHYIWTAGASWISPTTDVDAVLRLCELTDFGEKMKRKFFDTGDTHYAKDYYGSIDRQIALMRELGLTPAARSRLGVAEVKTKSRIQQLQLEREREERKRREAAQSRSGD